MTPKRLQQILIDNGIDPLGNALWARQALVGVALDARDVFHEADEISDEEWESFCDEIVSEWPEL